MSKDMTRLFPVGAGYARPGVGALAARALTQVRVSGRLGASPRDPAILETLRDMVLASPAIAPDEIVSEMRALGVSNADIVDHCIPATARILGDCWLSDELSFAQVSIGSARLQGLLPLLDDRPATGRAMPTAALLLVLPAGADHSLGTFVLAHRLRRAGYAVHVKAGAFPGEIAHVVAQGGFDAILLSCPTAASLVSVTDLVDRLRNDPGVVPPLVLGGAGVSGQDNLAGRTGVDIVVSEYQDLLQVLSMRAPIRATRR